MLTSKTAANQLSTKSSKIMEQQPEAPKGKPVGMLDDQRWERLMISRLTERLGDDELRAPVYGSSLASFLGTLGWTTDLHMLPRFDYVLVPMSGYGSILLLSANCLTTLASTQLSYYKGDLTIPIFEFSGDIQTRKKLQGKLRGIDVRQDQEPLSYHTPCKSAEIVVEWYLLSRCTSKTLRAETYSTHTTDGRAMISVRYAFPTKG
ncbi:hypothetical protein TWF225_003264 [Orbilia oligospora]|uniref:Uncharacterized protein n=1 Tax=Orbilia oligospora TaxID=2813651 RepID=A0A7C8PWZ8_ORBOL|nr:hypothetical protein TWF751_005931 [Orbilia oligospora]KAF3188891.1 hypothetical protein TWF225_003264 [Orbilia oligospora]KAF3267337.1 hypothetical protein TWF217_000407 [Orbilia oligospora]TGJ69210.1 hypothetical protein EYR41_005266 [Orbilia oligospora]